MPVLNNLIRNLKKPGIAVIIHRSSITVDLQLEKCDFLRSRPYLYLLINKFGQTHFLVIKGLPYCLMPDAEAYLLYQKEPKNRYFHDKLCSKCRLKLTCPGWPESLRTFFPERLPLDNLPAEIVFELTGNCNQNCLICFNNNKQLKKEHSFLKIKEIIDICCNLKINTVRFTGGEPLLYRNIEAVLGYAKQKNLSIILNTNATIIDKRTKQLLKNYVDYALISLQGFNNISEEKLTRSGLDFKNKLKNILDLNYMLPKVRLGTVISRTLCNNLKSYYMLIKKLNIKDWSLFRPMLNSRLDEFRMSPQGFIKLMKALRALNSSYGMNSKICNALPFCIAGDFNLSDATLIGAREDDGHTRLILDSRGFFKPSYFINKNLGSDLKKAWLNPFIKRLRSLNFLPQKCNDCFYLKWCKGGSRYWAKIVYGDYFKPDPLIDNG